MVIVEDAAPTQLRTGVGQLRTGVGTMDRIPRHAKSDAFGRLRLVALAVAFGVLLVAVGYPRGRANQPWSAPLYWIGDSLILLAPACLLLSRRKITGIEAGGVAIIISIATYAVKECYSPLQFTFSDQFQHYPTIQAILATHHLFQPNPSLPVSPFYPGIEVVSSAVIELSHISIYTAAAILLGVAHLVTTIGLFFLAYEVISSYRVAMIAVLIYAIGPDYQFFNSYFAYESLGLPLVIISLLALAKVVNGSPNPFVWSSICLASGAATTVTHHVSSYVLVAMECVIAAMYRIYGTRSSYQWLVATVTITTGTFVLFWDVAVAKPTFGYLRAAFSELLVRGGTVSNVSPAVLPLKSYSLFSTALASKLAPHFDRAAAYLWAILLSITLVIGLWKLWRNYTNSSPLLKAMFLSAPILFIAFVIQELAPGGGQVGSRLEAFALIPGSIVCGIAIDSMITRRRIRHARDYSRMRLGATSIVAALLVIGSIAVSFPLSIREYRDPT